MLMFDVLSHVNIPTGSIERHLDECCCLPRGVWRQSRLLRKEKKQGSNSVGRHDVKSLRECVGGIGERGELGAQA